MGFKSELHKIGHARNRDGERECSPLVASHERCLEYDIGFESHVSANDRLKYTHIRSQLADQMRPVSAAATNTLVQARTRSTVLDLCIGQFHHHVGMPHVSPSDTNYHRPKGWT